VRVSYIPCSVGVVGGCSVWANSRMECKIDLTAVSDRAYWIRWAAFLECLDHADFACRDSETIRDCYLSSWFYDANGEKRFNLPAFFLREGYARFINGRHRTALLSRYLDVLPMALTYADQLSEKVLEGMVLRGIEPDEIIVLPDLPIEDSIAA